MKKQILFILLVVLAAAFLVLFFIFYGKNLSDLVKKITNPSSNTNRENMVTRGNVDEIAIQLNDAEKELKKLEELAQDQESLSRIDQLFSRIDYFRAEFKKPAKEIDKKTTEEFYNSGFWESIADLKFKLEGVPQNNNYMPELE